MIAKHYFPFLYIPVCQSTWVWDFRFQRKNDCVARRSSAVNPMLKGPYIKSNDPVANDQILNLELNMDALRFGDGVWLENSFGKSSGKYPKETIG